MDKGGGGGTSLWDAARPQIKYGDGTNTPTSARGLRCHSSASPQAYPHPLVPCPVCSATVSRALGRSGPVGPAEPGVHVGLASALSLGEGGVAVADPVQCAGFDGALGVQRGAGTPDSTAYLRGNPRCNGSRRYQELLG